MPLVEAALLAKCLFPQLASKDVAREGERGLQVAAKVAGDTAVLSPGARMLARARMLLAATKDDSYSHIPDIEPAKGIFHADCSELIDDLARNTNPDALKELPLDAGHPEPRAENYADFLRSRPLVGSASPGEHWGQVPSPSRLAPGDVIAWKNDAYVPGQSSTGHVMLVSDVPQPVRDGSGVVGYNVPIIDSTSHGHGPGDDRVPGVKTGLGQGTVYFPVAEDGHATGFSWTPAGAAGAAPPRPPALGFGRLLD